MDIFNYIVRKLSGNGHRIPLIQVSIDIFKYRINPIGSCMCHFHPKFENDMKLQKMAFDMTEYIRSNYDMEKLIEIKESTTNDTIDTNEK